MPYIDFTRQAGINNKGSVGKLTNYLKKEDRQMEKEGKREFYFDHERTDITKNEVDKHIDTNRQGLKKKDAKFYMITINPSKEELAHIGTDAGKFREWVQKEYIPQLTKDFNRKELKPSDLNIYGKIEYHRYYKGTDNEVQTGQARSGDAKPGNNMHCHLILGRKSRDKKHYLSPNANARKKGQQGAAINAGFDRNSHKIIIERSWDRYFTHERKYDQSFEVKQELKLSKSIEERASVMERYEVEKTTTIGQEIERKYLSKSNRKIEKEVRQEKEVVLEKGGKASKIPTEKEVKVDTRPQEKLGNDLSEKKEEGQKIDTDIGQERAPQPQEKTIEKEQVATNKAENEGEEIEKGISKESLKKERTTIEQEEEKSKEEDQEKEVSEEKEQEIDEGIEEKTEGVEQDIDTESKEKSVGENEESKEESKQQEKGESTEKKQDIDKKQERPIQKNDRDQGMGIGF